AAEKPPGPDDEYERHDDVFDRERDLRETEADAERFDFADQQCGEEGARDGAKAADDDDDKGIRNRSQIDAQACWLPRHGESAAEAGEERTQRKDPGEEPALVHAKGAGHFT